MAGRANNLIMVVDDDQNNETNRNFGRHLGTSSPPKHIRRGDRDGVATTGQQILPKTLQRW